MMRTRPDAEERESRPGWFAPPVTPVPSTQVQKRYVSLSIPFPDESDVWDEPVVCPTWLQSALLSE